MVFCEEIGGGIEPCEGWEDEDSKMVIWPSQLYQDTAYSIKKHETVKHSKIQKIAKIALQKWQRWSSNPRKLTIKRRPLERFSKKSKPPWKLKHNIPKHNIIITI